MPHIIYIGLYSKEFKHNVQKTPPHHFKILKVLTFQSRELQKYKQDPKEYRSKINARLFNKTLQTGGCMLATVMNPVQLRS
jgi:hypothetical protein